MAQRTLRLGDRLRLPFGGFGTQIAAVEEIKGERIGVRRFRERSGKWNKRLEWWTRAALLDAITSPRKP